MATEHDNDDDNDDDSSVDGYWTLFATCRDTSPSKMVAVLPCSYFQLVVSSWSRGSSKMTSSFDFQILKSKTKIPTTKIVTMTTTADKEQTAKARPPSSVLFGSL
jgi:hypothetical protein